MKIEIQPVSVSHESILALHLHEQYLTQEYERIVAVSGSITLSENKRVIKELTKRIKDCEKAREYLEKNYVNLEEIEDKTDC